MTSGQPIRVFVSMPRFSLKSIVLFAVAFCLSWQSAVTGISTARAGCGDYVHLGGMEFSAHAGGSAEAETSLDDQAKNGNVPRRPCQGPHCGQQPSTPAAPAPVSTMGGPQRQACLIELGVPNLPASNFLVPDISAPYGKLPETQIERPPRRCA